MFRDHKGQDAGNAYTGSLSGKAASLEPNWTVIIPFFNERAYLPATLSSIAGQQTRPRVILVDNGSTDGSGQFAETLCQQLSLDYRLIVERRPGKVAALDAGLRCVSTEFVATCDADTWYPANYLAQAERLLARDGTAAVGAYYAPATASPRQRLATALHVNAIGRLLSWQCHAGGAGQAFRTDRLRLAGGFDPAIWNWVLEDHEIMHRVAKTGAVRYGLDFWCAPADRDRDRDSIRWNLIERILYHVCPARWQGAYFYNILGPRLGNRKLSSARIRERQYQTIGAIDHAAPDLVCG